MERPPVDLPHHHSSLTCVCLSHQQHNRKNADTAKSPVTRAGCMGTTNPMLSGSRSVARIETWNRIPKNTAEVLHSPMAAIHRNDRRGIDPSNIRNVPTTLINASTSL